MHATHWGFDKPPFPTGTAESVFFLGVPQQEALARLRFLVQNKRRLGLVRGGLGCGKTMILQCFAQECHRNSWRTCQLNLLGMSVREFHWQLAWGLEAAPRSTDDALRSMSRWEQQLRQNLLMNEPTVILLDDADQAGADLKLQLLRLVQLPAHQVGDLTVLMSCQTAQECQLGNRVLDLVDLRIDLDPWTGEDTTGYLEMALVEAGATRPLFDEQALAEIQRLTSGVPRQVNRLADYALVVGSSQCQGAIDAATVAAADAVLNPQCPS